MKFKRLTILLLLLLCLALVGCQVKLPSGSTKPTSSSTASSTTSTTSSLTKDEFITLLTELSTAEKPEKDYALVTQWLLVSGINGFIEGKLETVERIYEAYFIKEVPDSYTTFQSMSALLAEATAEDLFDYTDKDEFTDYLIAAYLYSVGDVYASYMNAENYALYTSDFAGEYVGIGVSAMYLPEEGCIQVITVMDDSPAEQEGMVAGDKILTVDGESVASLGYYGAINRIRGEENTTVTLTVLRGDTILEFTLTRAAFVEQTVYFDTITQGQTKLGYIRVTTFSEVTAPQFKDAIEQLERQGVSGLIFDMRNNGGGLLTAVLEMLDYLLPDGGPIANYLYYNGQTEVSYAEDGHAVNLPMTVICNQYTASAAELFTSALQDYHAKGKITATVVGDITYGKGTMQTLIEFTDDTAMTISFAYYQPPYSPNYEGIGITPDVSVSLAPALEGTSPDLLTPEQDTQLAKAIECLCPTP